MVQNLLDEGKETKKGLRVKIYHLSLSYISFVKKRKKTHNNRRHESGRDRLLVSNGSQVRFHAQ